MPRPAIAAAGRTVFQSANGKNAPPGIYGPVADAVAGPMKPGTFRIWTAFECPLPRDTITSMLPAWWRGAASRSAAAACHRGREARPSGFVVRTAETGVVGAAQA